MSHNGQNKLLRHARKAVAEAIRDPRSSSYQAVLDRSIVRYNEGLRDFLKNIGKTTENVPEGPRYPSAGVRRLFETDPLLNTALIANDPIVERVAVPVLQTAIDAVEFPTFPSVLRAYCGSYALRGLEGSKTRRIPFVFQGDKAPEEDEGWTTVKRRRRADGINRYVFPSAEAKVAFLYHPAMVALWKPLPQSPEWDLPMEAPVYDVYE